jgi:surface polysaccharide O-acyltransferase-like enzyme
VTAPIEQVATAPSPRPVRRWEFDALRVVAICGVVAIHVIGMMVINRDLRGTPQWWAAVAVHAGSTWVVPVFVMLSGALVLAPSAYAAGTAAFYRKRFVRIVPALVVWHVVYLVGVRVWLLDQDVTARSAGQMLLDARAYTALYFLWLIAGLYLIAPVLAAFLHAGGHRRAMVTAAVALCWGLVLWIVPNISTLLGTKRSSDLGAWDQWVPYVGYFVAGWALHRLVLGRRLLPALLAATVFLLGELIWQSGHQREFRLLNAVLPVHRLGLVAAAAAICVFLLAVGVGARYTPPERLRALLTRLSDASFGVFLVHLVLFAIVQRAVPAVRAADSLTVLVGAYLAVLGCSFALSIGAARVPYLRNVF